jgi:hypothetical protein
MWANLNEIPLAEKASLPAFFNGVFNYDKAAPDVHAADGWREVVAPVLGPTEKLGDLVYDEEADLITYEILEKSETELEAERRAAIPFSIAPAQGRIALARRGLLAAIQSAIPTDVEDPTRIYWEYAISWERSHPLINQLAAALGLTEAQVDEIFIEAASNGL